MRPVVVGASVAGAVCALRLARSGVACVVLDRRARPGDKVCGEGLLPAGRAVVEELVPSIADEGTSRATRRWCSIRCRGRG